MKCQSKYMPEFKYVLGKNNFATIKLPLKVIKYHVTLRIVATAPTKMYRASRLVVHHNAYQV